MEDPRIALQRQMAVYTHEERHQHRATDLIVDPDIPARSGAIVGDFTTAEDAIEVKYTPNRAERRARQREARRSVRRGIRAQDRKIAELQKTMTLEEIDHAKLLAEKQAQINALRGGRG